VASSCSVDKLLTLRTTTLMLDSPHKQATWPEPNLLRFKTVMLSFLASMPAYLEPGTNNSLLSAVAH
jgi:hypothetical protein